MIAAGRARRDQAIRPWGHDPVRDKHSPPQRSQRAPWGLSLLAQDSGTPNLVAANADLAKATQA